MFAIGDPGHVDEHNRVFEALASRGAVPPIAMLSPTPSAGTLFSNCINATAGTTRGGTVGLMSLAPLLCPFDLTIDTMSVRVSTGSAGATIKVVVYASDPTTGLPGALIHETADGSAASTNVTVSWAFAHTFTANVIYWIGVRHSSASPVLRAHAVGATPSLGFLTDGATSPTNILEATNTYADPAPDPAGLTLANRASQSAFRVMLHAA